MIITDAMVQRALQAFYSTSRGNLPLFIPDMRKALEAALNEPTEPSKVIHARPPTQAR